MPKEIVDESIYSEITDEKAETLGKEISVKALCDVWWNSVNFNKDGKWYVVWKDLEGKYSWNGKGSIVPQDILNLKIKTKNYIDNDTDGYPIIWGTPVKSQEKTR